MLLVTFILYFHKYRRIVIVTVLYIKCPQFGPTLTYGQSLVYAYSEGSYTIVPVHSITVHLCAIKTWVC